MKRLKLKNENGSMAVEFIIIILPCIILMFMFLNVLMIVGNLMLAQSASDRTVQQVAALGCLPFDLKTNIENRNNYLGVNNVEVVAYKSNNTWSQASWSKAAALNNPIVCNSPTSFWAPRAFQEQYVYVQLKYTQDLVLIPGATSVNLDVGSLSVSSSLERQQ